ncbi:MAG: nucleotidyltransferase, partial [Anaerolineae bacterium]|nr:nucleotidyltransferase [Anaerolineae bacterium]NIO00273.1 nucleotidyltransferase [Anaerolineae bacterium]NIQ83052.1 nucleotidyltransferase [Anaerolineae bacterium]
DRDAKLEVGTVDVWEDCGKPETLLATNRYLLDKGGGQEIATDNSVLIPPVHIASSASIANSVVGPYVSVAEEVVIENSIISDCIIDRAAHIEHAILRQSLVGSETQVRGGVGTVELGDHSKVNLG